MFLPIPYGVEGVATRPPRATVGLIALNVLVFLLVLSAPRARGLEQEEASLERLAAWELDSAVKNPSSRR